MTTLSTTAKRSNMSFAPEVSTDSTSTFSGNALRFATREEAQEWVTDLSYRWILVRDTRVVESTDPVSHRMVDGRLEFIK